MQSSSSSSSSSSSFPNSNSIRKEDCEVLDITSAAPANSATVQKSKGEKRFNKRDLDFTAEPLDYVAVYPAKDEATDGYRFWVARTQEPISYEKNRKKKIPVVYFCAKGNTNYLQFEQESPKKVKIYFGMLLGRIDSASFEQVSDSQVNITAEERDKWSALAKELDNEN